MPSWADHYRKADWPNLIIKSNEICNRGVFSTKPIEKGAVVTAYYVSDEEPTEDMDEYSISIGMKGRLMNGFVHAQRFAELDGARFYGNMLNHAVGKHANCILTKKKLDGNVVILVLTKKKILVGQQLLFDYYSQGGRGLIRREYACLCCDCCDGSFCFCLKHRGDKTFEDNAVPTVETAPVNDNDIDDYDSSMITLPYNEDDRNITLNHEAPVLAVSTDDEVTCEENKLVLRYETGLFVNYPKEITDKKEKKYCPICANMVNRKMKKCITTHVAVGDAKLWYKFHAWWVLQKKNCAMLDLINEFNNSILTTNQSTDLTTNDETILPHLADVRYAPRSKQCRLLDALAYRLDEPHPLLTALNEMDDGMPRSILKKRKYSIDDVRRKTSQSYKKSTSTNFSTLLYYSMRFCQKKEIDWKDISVALNELKKIIQKDNSMEMKGSVITMASECVRAMQIISTREKAKEEFQVCLEQLRYLKGYCEVILKDERIERKLEWSIPTFFSMYATFNDYATGRLREIKDSLEEEELELHVKENFMKELSVLLCLFLQFHMGLRPEIYYKIKTAKLKEALKTDISKDLPVVPFESKNSDRLYAVIQPCLLVYYNILIDKKKEILKISKSFSSDIYAFAGNEKKRLEVDVLNYPNLLQSCPAVRYPMDIRRSYVRAIEAYGQENTEMLDMLHSLHSRTQGHSRTVRAKEYLPLTKSIALLAYSNTMKLVRKDYENILRADLLNIVLEASPSSESAPPPSDCNTPHAPKRRCLEMDANNNVQVLAEMKRQIEELLKEKEEKKKAAMEQMECFICLNVKSSKITFIPCLHVACTDCAFALIAQSNGTCNCPLCRKRINDVGPDLNHQKLLSDFSESQEMEQCEKRLEDVKSKLSRPIFPPRNVAPIFFRRPVVEYID